MENQSYNLNDNTFIAQLSVNDTIEINGVKGNSIFTIKDLYYSGLESDFKVKIQSSVYGEIIYNWENFKAMVRKQGYTIY